MPNPSSRPLPRPPLPTQPPPTFRIFLEDVYLVTDGGYLLSARWGGEDIGDDAIQTECKYVLGTQDPPPLVGPFELFKLWTNSTGGFAFQTSGGRFITAVGGGGRTTDVIHTDALSIGAWEEFQIAPTGPASALSVSIQTRSGNFLTAVGMGGKTLDAIHSNATVVGSWERFFVRKWGFVNPTSGYEYFIVDTDKNQAIAARGGGGQTQNTIQFSGENDVPLDWSIFTLVLQSNYSYGIRTVNGNYVTAVNSGGLDYGTTTTDNIHTDATAVNTWEQFNFVHSGDGTFLIRTFDGHFLGKRTFGGSAEGEYSTDISDPAFAKKFWVSPAIFFEQ